MGNRGLYQRKKELEMTIVYILPSLEHNGGAERIISEKANYIAEYFGHSVYMITLFQNNGSLNYYHLSSKVHQINLDIPYHTQYNYKYPKRLWIKFHINCNMRKQLSQTVNMINPDILIGVSYSKAELICSIPCKAKKIIECHEPKSLISSKIYNGSLFSKLYTKYYYFKSIEQRADLIVTLTNEGKKEWEKAKRVEAIPNFSSMSISQYSTCTTKKIIAVGRLREEKGFDRLIDIWKMISEKYPDWQLNIFGEGYLKDELNNKIKTSNLKNITLQGSTSNISKEYSTSSICVSTSYLEGFSLTLLEAMRHGVPCVAFNCPYGPANIIKNDLCGYLIDNNNNSLFAEKLCALIEDESLRHKFSQECLKQVKLFDVDIIMKQWQDLFKSLQ